MYNRYIQNQRVPFPCRSEESAPDAFRSPPCGPPPPPPAGRPQGNDFIRRLLRQFGLGSVDTGDLLLLLILFLLFSEGENRDEELLIALGLLLIL